MPYDLRPAKRRLLRRGKPGSRVRLPDLHTACGRWRPFASSLVHQLLFLQRAIDDASRNYPHLVTTASRSGTLGVRSYRGVLP